MATTSPPDTIIPQRRPADIRKLIQARALHIGFDAIGFCEASLGPEAKDRLHHFINEGYHGTMGWIADRVSQRSHPRSLWPEAKSVIVVGLSYAPKDDPMSIIGQSTKGAISVYARNRDYHDLIKGKLKQLAQFMAAGFQCGVKVFVDTAPVMEKPLAQQSGIGWQGKHTNLVSRSFGSWLLLGEIYTTLALKPDEPSTDRCGSCSRCLDVCPTQAFTAPYQLNATRCISYLTIEHKGPIPHNFREAIGNRIYGCDDCLAVCPWNKFAVPTDHQQLVARDDLIAPRLATLASLNQSSFRAMFSGSPIKRIGRDRFVRNVLIAIGNSKDPALRPYADALRQDADAIVAEAADWASRRLTSSSA